MKGPLTWQVVRLSLATTLETKADVRAADPRQLAVVRDVHFDEIGGAGTRLPFLDMGSLVFGGGSLADCRRVVAYGNELLVMTDDEVYSWNEQLDRWVLRGTHLACSIDEQSRFVTTDDQLDADRAELNNTIVYVWQVAGAATISYAAALDKATGSVLMSPTAINAGATASRPHLVALSTKLLLTFQDGASNLKAYALDPAAPATALAGAATTILAGAANFFYDAERVPATDTAIVAVRRTVTTSYEVLKVTAALAVTAATKARTCDGPIACAVDPTGTHVQIVRANVTNIQGDLLLVSTLADVFTGQAIGTVLGTPVNQIAAAYRNVQNGGQYRCYAFWSFQESTTNSAWATKSNFVDDAGSLGAQVTLVRRLGVASRAFSHGGSVYVWLVFGGQSGYYGTGVSAAFGSSLQNAYFLYRDDAFLVAKSADGEAGGFAASTGRLPGVSLTGGLTSYSWCGVERRVITVDAKSTNYGARAPRDIVFTFDSNDARRTAPIGKTLYIASGEVLQYDGTQLAEVGFHLFPWFLALIDAGGGSMAPGTYAYKNTVRWDNGQGELDRSSTATVATVVVTGSSVSLVANWPALYVTHKTVNPPAQEIWRSPVNPQGESPFALVSSKDPAGTANPNRYVANDIAADSLPTFNDFLSDAQAGARETNPENGLAIGALSPPGASIIIATDTRIFLAGVSGDADAIWYSRERGDNEVASFHDTLRVDVPREGGRITSIWFLDDVLYASRETAIYALPGVGLDNLGQGQNFGPARTISLDVGCVSHDAQALTPVGLLFKSRKGWYLLNGRDVRYVGGNVAAFDDDTVHAVNVMHSKHHVRILTSGRMLVWDYRQLIDSTNEPGPGQWAEWTIADGVHACVWQGRHVYLTAAGPRIEAASFAGTTHGLDIETKWIPPAELQGAAKVKAAGILGEHRSEHLLRIRAARDWQYDGAGNVVYFDDRVWTPPATAVGSALQVMPCLTQWSMQALKLRITAVTDLTRATLVTTALVPQVATNGTAWNSTWRAVDSYPGEMGNRITMSVAFISEEAASDVLPYDLPFDLDFPPAIMVKDHFAWSQTEQRWVEDVDNIGVLIVGQLTVAEVEAAVVAGTALATLTAADPGFAKVTSAAMLGLSCAASFTGGTYGAPAGEALKLTHLALEVGIRQGISRGRLSGGQKV